jgi:hypothetical protein
MEQLQSHGKGFLIYEEMRKYLVIYEEPLVIYDFANSRIPSRITVTCRLCQSATSTVSLR